MVLIYTFGTLAVLWGLYHVLRIFFEWRSDQARLIRRAPDKRTNRAASDWRR